jgi:hypothetical protein
MGILLVGFVDSPRDEFVATKVTMAGAIPVAHG